MQYHINDKDREVNSSSEKYVDNFIRITSRASLILAQFSGIGIQYIELETPTLCFVLRIVLDAP